MKIFRQSLRSKLIGVFLVPTLLIVSLYGFLAYFAGRQGLEDELGKRLVTIGETLGSGMSEGFDAKQITRLDDTKTRVLARLNEDLRLARDATEVRRLYIFARDRTVIADTSGTPFGERLYELDPHGAEVDRVFAEGGSEASVLFQGPDGLPYKSGFVPITSDGEVVAAIGVEGSASYFELLSDFASALTLLGFIGLLLVVAAATIFSRQLVAPLNRLVAAAQRLGAGDTEEPIATPEGNDEIAFLGRSFEEMRQNIVSRDRQMQMMLSGIAHEVRNPLGGMELFCGLLAEDLADASLEVDDARRDEMTEKVAKIQRELDYLERVVTDFLDFARHAPPDLERFSARDFLREVDDLLSGEVIDSGCAIVTVAEPDDAELTADRQKLRRAVINVVRNAYQACGTGGHIEVRVVEEGDVRLVRISDDGPGIPRESIEDVLTPFYTTKEKGSGLGLALTHRILEQHGGELRVASGEEGTTIDFVLPFDTSLEPASAQEIPEGWLG